MQLIIDYRKDVRLPVMLQRAMAAEAEAVREARAKVMLRLLPSFTFLIITFDCVQLILIVICVV